MKAHACILHKTVKGLSGVTYTMSKLFQFFHEHPDCTGKDLEKVIDTANIYSRNDIKYRLLLSSIKYYASTLINFFIVLVLPYFIIIPLRNRIDNHSTWFAFAMLISYIIISGIVIIAMLVFIKPKLGDYKNEVFVYQKALAFKDIYEDIDPSV